MVTRVFGCSDDLIEISGDLCDEVNFYDGEKPALITFSDGTLLAVRYGKPGCLSIWAIDLIRAGDLFNRIEVCLSEDDDPYSDQAFFDDGLKWAYVATQWQKI